MLAECIRMINIIGNISQQSRHTAILAEGLRALAIHEAEKQISELRLTIDRCQSMLFKRLECESHLVHACLQLILSHLNNSDMGETIHEQLERARSLCRRYPDTAGLLLPAYHHIKRAMTGTRAAIVTLCDVEFKDVWWHWPEHYLGALEQCSNGHLYSSHKRPGCPECGRVVEDMENLPPVPLQDVAFLHAMTTLSVGFDGAAYRR